MKIIVKHLPLFGSICQIEDFLNANKRLGVKYEIPSVREKYEFIKNVLWAIGYNGLSRSDKHIVFCYIACLANYSNSQIKRLVKKWRQGKLFYNPTKQRNKFARKYFPSDIALLIQTDVLHDCISGEATSVILKREFNFFGRTEYGNISNISVPHIYNIRNKNVQYNSSEAKFHKRTQAVSSSIGIRQKPRPDGRPGYLRIDTVHQGDRAMNKGVYHINIVDEVTQFELIATIPNISQQFLEPVIMELLKQFPFVIYEFHSDNGSEFINRTVAKLLNKLHIQMTKSRSRQTNDNALIESKNGGIIRKIYGRNFIAKHWATKINEFNRKYVNIYLNYHRPCGFSEDVTDKRGKIKKHYNQWLTPYEKLKSLENAEQYLKPEFSFAELDKIAKAKSDNQFAMEMNKEKSKLFKLINKNNQPPE